MVCSAFFQILKAAPDACEEPFNQPAPWLDGEADLIGLPLDDLGGNGIGFSDSRILIPSVVEHLADAGDGRRRSCGKRRAQSRSWILARCGNMPSVRPLVSTSAWRL